MSTMTAAQVTGWRIRLDVVVDDMASTSRMSIIRTGPDGSTAPIIGVDHVTPASGVWDDPEAPLWGISTWTLREHTQTGVTVDRASVQASVQADRPVLSDPAAQASAQVVVLAAGQDRTMAGRASSVDIVGRSTRVWSWDVEAAPTLSPQLITDTVEDHAGVEACCAGGSPVLLRYPDPRIPDRWLQRGGDRSWSWLSRRCVARKHTLSNCEELESAPAGLAAAAVFGDTLGDLDNAAQALGGDAAGTLAAISDRWTTLGGIAATDLKALT